MPDEEAIHAALRSFAQAVTAKSNQLTVGDAEDQLRGPFDTFMQEVGRALSLKVVCTGETTLADRLGKPDYAVHAADLLAGYAELKAPGTGANPKHFKGHNRKQWKRFENVPNLLYTDGNEWGLFQSGKRARPLVRFSGDVAADGAKAVTPEDAKALTGLLTDFLQWDPTIPTKGKDGKIDLKAFAAMLAPLCRMLRADVGEALKDPESSLVDLAAEWRQLLFPDADDEQFADAYAQTVTFALLLARGEGAEPLDLATAERALAIEHSLLSRTLQLLTEVNAKPEIEASLDLLLRVIGKVPVAALRTPRESWLFRYEDTLPVSVPEDPWLYFYEDFLAAYDPDLRRDAGAYYTPVEVVLAQVRLVDDLLKNRLSKQAGFADPEVITLDPATGTGTYLLGVIDHALGTVRKSEGPGAVAGRAKALAKNIYGFERMVGPFAVSELRITRALHDWGARLPKDGTNVYLTDTLESPFGEAPRLGTWYREITEQHAKALKVKAEVPVIVCLGNPPYDRHPAVDPTDEDLSKYGGWVRFGDPAVEETVGRKREKRAKKQPTRLKKTSPAQRLARREQQSILYKAFIQPTKDAGHGGHLKNAYNLYVYFWRWALWKVFEADMSAGPGVVSFISASSYLDGDAFCGMREHMRRVCDDIWIIALGGEGRGTRQDENVFAIRTPVAIAVAFRQDEPDADTPAKVHYARIEGTRKEKLSALNDVAGFSALTWQDCP
ncbi:MAG: N-6 DNA methylase, partial [Phycisphaerae bacterium]|nr:N-6 DNA methylase [Phycisphaerae bacterium]